MKKLHSGLVIAFLAIFGFFLFSNNVSAAKMYSDYNDCISKSDGRGEISSVQWACNQYVYYNISNSYGGDGGTYNTCSLWIGDSKDSTSTKIVVSTNSDKSSFRVLLYGMCTVRTNPTSSIQVLDNSDNGALNLEGKSLTRGTWGSPTSTPVTMDVDKFIEGLEGEEGPKGIEYTRFVNIQRCHGIDNTGSCSSEYDPITVVVEKTARFAGQSQVSNRASSTASSDLSDYVTTEVTENYATASTDTINLKVGEKANITFSHNVYSTKSLEKVNWKVERSVNGGSSGISGNGFSVSTSSNSNSSGGTGSLVSGVANATKKREGDSRYYIGGPRPYNDGGEDYILRDFYEVTFTKKGTYRFCETLSVGESASSMKEKTQVCSTIVVGDSLTPPEFETTCNAWTPSDYSSGTTSVTSRILNSRLKSDDFGMNGWRGDTNTTGTTIYAAPTDMIQWKNCYFPGVQKFAETKLTYLEGIHNGHAAEDVCHDTTNDNKEFQSLITWTNEYSVLGETNFGLNDLSGTVSNPFTKTFPLNGGYEKLANGKTDIKVKENNYLINKLTDVGQTFYDEIKTPGTPVSASIENEGIHDWTACCGCGCCTSEDCECACCVETYYHTNDYVIGSYTNGARESSSYVRVPYNFKNSAEVELKAPRGENVVYAGETIEVTHASVTVGTRTNQVVERTYATQVHNAEVKLIAFDSARDRNGENVGPVSYGSDLCTVLDKRINCVTVQDTGVTTLNEAGNLDGVKYDVGGYGNGNINASGTKRFPGTYNVFDVNAGDHMCFALAVYPASSGPDGDTGDNGDRQMNASGDGNWAISTIKCIKVAKKPSFRVVGGSVFSNGGMMANISEKNNLFEKNNSFGGLLQYQPFYSDTVGQRVEFGSWVEEAIVANGAVDRVASGASIGYNDGTTPVSYGVWDGELDFCKYWVPLTFANYSSAIGYPCSGGNKSAGGAGIWPPTSNRSALVDYWGVVEVTESDNAVQVYDIANSSGWTEVGSLNEKNILVLNTDNTVTIHSGTIVRNQTRIVKTTESVNISGNIKYANEELSSAGEVPQVVIYAGGNINISCSVEQIDAILITKGTVNTCYRGVANSFDAGAHPLKIRGMVIANKVEATREYGNGVGDHSGDPAETINYDTSALVWGRYMAGSGESNTLTLTYQHELAPRL